jgi:hypothetical protein
MNFGLEHTIHHAGSSVYTADTTRSSTSEGSYRTLVLNGWFMPLMFLTGLGATQLHLSPFAVFLTSDTMLSDTTS